MTFATTVWDLGFAGPGREEAVLAILLEKRMEGLKVECRVRMRSSGK